MDLGYNFLATKACGKHVFGFEFDGEIHDGLFLSIMETFHVVDLHEEVSSLLEPSSSCNRFSKHCAHNRT